MQGTERRRPLKMIFCRECAKRARDWHREQKSNRPATPIRSKNATTRV